MTTRSIHQENWPAVVEFESVRLPEKEGVLAVAIHILTEIRGAKSQAQKNTLHCPYGLRHTACHRQRKPPLQ